MSFNGGRKKVKRYSDAKEWEAYIRLDPIDIESAIKEGVMPIEFVANKCGSRSKETMTFKLIYNIAQGGWKKYASTVKRREEMPEVLDDAEEKIKRLLKLYKEHGLYE